MRAERRAGELLREMEKQTGARGTPGPGMGNKTAESPRNDTVLTSVPTPQIPRRLTRSIVRLAKAREDPGGRVTR
jgi:hypothetical protein